jgi:hypothetical protein
MKKAIILGVLVASSMFGQVYCVAYLVSAAPGHMQQYNECEREEQARRESKRQQRFENQLQRERMDIEQQRLQLEQQRYQNEVNRQNKESK